MVIAVLPFGVIKDDDDDDDDDDRHTVQYINARYNSPSHRPTVPNYLLYMHCRQAVPAESY